MTELEFATSLVSCKEFKHVGKRNYQRLFSNKNKMKQNSIWYNTKSPITIINIMASTYGRVCPVCKDKHDYYKRADKHVDSKIFTTAYFINTKTSDVYKKHSTTYNYYILKDNFLDMSFCYPCFKKYYDLGIRTGEHLSEQTLNHYLSNRLKYFLRENSNVPQKET